MYEITRDRHLDLRTTLIIVFFFFGFGKEEPRKINFLIAPFTELVTGTKKFLSGSSIGEE